MERDEVFLFVGVAAAIAAAVAFGLSVSIIARSIRERRSHRMLWHVVPLAISWNLFAMLFTYRFWSGAYDPSNLDDRIVLSFVLAAFSVGCSGIYWLWTHPHADRR